METCCPGRKECEGSSDSGSSVPDHWEMFAQTAGATGWAARQLSEVGLGACLDSALGCHTPESGSVAFLPSFLLVISAGEAAGQLMAAAT